MGGWQGLTRYVARIDSEGEFVDPLEVDKVRELGLHGQCVTTVFPPDDPEDAWLDYNFKNRRSYADLSERDKRAPTYSWYARQIYGVRGRHNRCRFAGCLLKGVRDKYPGAPYTEHEWQSVA
jgi:hypothetical protein